MQGACLDENDAVAFVEQRLSAEKAASIERHVDACDACRELLSAIAPLLDRPSAPAEHDGGVWATETLPAGMHVGRYVVLSRVGAGGMGVVYAAYDPKLDRKVALKLLRRSTESGAAQDRLLREAKAMAALSSPNVVTVHDVGTLGDQVFVAMEFLSGGTLKEWLKSPRTSAEVIDVLVQAGRGLAAAHDANLVHRDFKPDNVMLAGDGRVCVTDFGLVRASADQAPTPGDVGSYAPVATDATATGTLLGTPGYIAPEQRAGSGIDARADQWSFSVTLWEALHGERPPSTGSTARSVPAFVVSALRKGLAERPEERFSSMHELLAALTADPSARRGRRLRTAAALLVVGAAAAALGRAASSEERPSCAGAETSLSAAWDPARRAAVSDAITRTNAPYAAALRERVVGQLDAYAAAWVATRTESCEATRVRGDQPDAIHALRTVCLDRRRQELGALVDVLAGTDAETVASAARAVDALVPVSVCSDTAALTARVTPPLDPAIRERVESVRADLARIKALGDSGRPEQALELARTTQARARETAHRATIAEALLTQAIVEQETVTGKGQATLVDAVNNAEASRQDEVAAAAWVRLVRTYTWRGAFGEAESAVARAEAAIDRLGGDVRLRDELLAYRGTLLLARNKPAESLALHQQSLAEQEKRLGRDDPALVRTLGELWRTAGILNDHATAAGAAERALAILRRALGDDHPDVADAQQKLGSAYAALGRLDEAVPLLRSSVATFERAHGPEHTRLAFPLLALGEALDKKGRSDEGLAAARRGVAIEEKSFGPKAPATANALASLCRVLLSRKDHREAKDTATRMIAIWDATVGPDHFLTAEARTLLGRAEAGLSR